MAQPTPETTPYELLGGADALGRIIERFYALMDSEPKFARIRELHPADLAVSAEKLTSFLSGWLGGPNLYMEKFGHPMLRARHLPFPIGVAERDAWLACMRRALEDGGVEPDLRDWLMQQLQGTADWVRNRPE
ncbi:MAG: group II truncated hemoglobin [Betaproteobacteria bacterium]|nr:group II truncated hemoglobin [Betaproteobacteria bacterium]